MARMFLRMVAALAVTVLLLSAETAAAQGQSETKRFFGVGEPLTAEDLPAGGFRDALLALPPQARANALGILRRSTTPAQDFVDMRVDERGFIFYVDPIAGEAEEGSEEPPPPSGITLANVFTLHSKPGASRVLYVDFDGHDLIDTQWNLFSGQPVLNMRPFDLDGDHVTFSQAEVDRIAESWRRVAEDFAPFDIDVTTEEPPFTIRPSGRIEYAPNVGHNLVTRQQDDNGYWVYTQGGCGCGGVAYLEVFGNSYLQPGLTFNTGISSNALTISHETGHNLGLGHDGTTAQGYYGGHGSGETSWGPIMGAPFGVSLSQWSRDEDYPDGNNPEDDFAVINIYLPFRSDDHEDVVLAAATPLLVTGGVNVVSQARASDPSWGDLANKGIIEDRTDIDLFVMNVGAGTIDLTIDPANYEVYEGSQGANVDIQTRLLDEYGGVLQTSNPDLSTSASINYAVTVAGIYYLEITGVSRNGTGGTDYGHSDYGSVGQYYINGTIPEDIVTTQPPIAPSDLIATLVGDSSIELRWTDPPSPPDADEAGYRVLRSVDGVPFSLRASLPRGSEFFADNNLGNGVYAYKLEVFNSAGTAETVATAPITVEAPRVAVATNESTVLGSIISGSYVSTQQASDSETLREERTGGRPSNRRSYLDHSWFVTGVVPGALVELYLSASAPSNSEGDSFAFSYSVAGGAPVEIGALLPGMSQSFTVALDPAISGTVEVKVVDTNRDQGASVLDTVMVHEISITSVGDPAEQAPVVEIVAPADGTIAPNETQLVFEATADDYEDGDLDAFITWSSSVDGGLGSGPNVAVILSGGMSPVSHLITASVTDSAQNISTVSITVNIDDTPMPTSMSVADLDAMGVPANGRKWQAQVTVTVRNNLGNPVADADVTGSWSNGTNGSGTCTTNASGVCTVTKSGLKNNVQSVDFTVSGIAGVLAYDAGDNVDPDGDSDGTVITIAKP